MGALVVLFVLRAYGTQAQELCRGDVDGDGIVTSADAVVLVTLLYDPLQGDAMQLLRADANDDGAISGADFIQIFLLDGLLCPPAVSPTPTPTATPVEGTPPTVTSTPTATSTRPSLPSPTPTCLVQEGAFGTTLGDLSMNDCQRSFFGEPRPTDEYSIVGTPGTAIKVEVSGEPPLVPHIRVVEVGGQFELVDDDALIEFTVTTTQPYQIFVTSAATSDAMVGAYSLTLTSRECPPPVAISLPSSRPAILDGTECPEPAFPSMTSLFNPPAVDAEPTDVYTFTVDQVPLNLSITMQQLSVDEFIFPVLSLIGPDGIELVTQDQNLDCTLFSGELLCAQIRFLALRTGTYTILAGGAGDTGRYALGLASPTCDATELNDIPADAPLHCAGSAAGCQGMLSGNITLTPCAAPLPVLGSIDEVPEPGSPADLYTFTADAGDVLSVEMITDDDAHLSILGPAPSTTVVARAGEGGDARLAATLATAGTYTLVVGNNNALFADDDPIPYTIFVQKCPLRGALNPSTGFAVSATFNGSECLGADDIPVRTYSFSGTAGEFVTTTMTSSTIDTFLRLFAPDGSQVINDDDLFNPTGTDARVNRLLPVDGTCFVEVSASPDGPPVDVGATPPPSFVLRARTCPTTAAASGSFAGTWEDTDCDLGGGRRGDVYTFAGTPAQEVATIAPPQNGCLVALLSDGLQVPGDGCGDIPQDLPVLDTREQAFVIAGVAADTRGAYMGSFSRCPLALIGYGTTRTATLSEASCVDAFGVKADRFFFQASADLVRLNVGVLGQVSANFPAAADVIDAFDTSSILGEFAEDTDEMFSLGANRGFFVRVRGATAGDVGSYTLSVDPAVLRQ